MNRKSTLLCWDYRHFSESHFAADLRTIFKYSWVLRDTSQLPSLLLLFCCHWWQRRQPLNETNRHRLYTVKVPVDQVSRISSGWLACDDSVSSVFVVLARRGAAVGPKKSVLSRCEELAAALCFSGSSPENIGYLMPDLGRNHCFFFSQSHCQCQSRLQAWCFGARLLHNN